MGTEYHLSCPPERLPDIADFLQRAGGLPCPQYPEQIEFRFRPCKPDDMPDAVVVIEADGLYFLDNGCDQAKVAHLFLQLVDASFDSSPKTVITRL